MHPDYCHLADIVPDFEGEKSLRIFEVEHTYVIWITRNKKTFSVFPPTYTYLRATTYALSVHPPTQIY